MSIIETILNKRMLTIFFAFLFKKTFAFFNLKPLNGFCFRSFFRVNFYSFFSASNCVRAVQNQPDTNCGVSDLKSFLYMNININIIQNCKTTKKSQFTLLHFCIHSVFRKIAKVSLFERFTSTRLFGRLGLFIVLLNL